MTTVTPARPAFGPVQVRPVESPVKFLLAAPVIYAGLLPFLLLDAFVTFYQRVCFPTWGVPLVTRREYMRFDRAWLPYLAWYQRVNCHYCSYANGLAAYFREVAARTEQYWCPVQHDQLPPEPHSRYHRFLPYGDARRFRNHAEEVSRDFSDLDANKEENRP